MSKEQELFNLQQELCPGCNKDVRTCPVQAKMRAFCPHCGGLFRGWNFSEDESKEKFKIPQFSGGYIETMFGDSSRPVLFACDCMCGKERQKANIETYDFTNMGDFSVCYQTRVRKIVARERAVQRVGKPGTLSVGRTQLDGTFKKDDKARDILNKKQEEEVYDL